MTKTVEEMSRRRAVEILTCLAQTAMHVVDETPDLKLEMIACFLVAMEWFGVSVEEINQGSDDVRITIMESELSE